jgi:competence protein ComEC
MFYVSLAATAGTLPLLIYHFNRLSLIGPVMNLILEPLLCLWALPLGLLAIPLIWLAPDLSVLLFNVGSAGIRLTVWIAEAVAGLPFASIWTITPSIPEIALFFIILFLLLHQGRTIRHLYGAGCLSVILLGSFTLSLWYPGTNKELTVSFLDVGQGSSTLLQLPNGKNILIDGGGYQSEQFNAGQGIIAPFLWRKRIWHLDDLVITHPHQDHYNGLPFIYARFQPQRLIVNGDSGNEPAYQQFLATVRKKGTPVIVATAGDALQQDKGLLLECLGMHGLLDQGPGWSTNDRSLVLRLHYGARSFLFPADIGTQSENRLMLHHGGLPRTDVLLAPHHGSITSAGQDFIAAIAPTLIVVSTSLTGLRTQSTAAHIKIWQQENIPAWVTAHQGTITSSTDGTLLRTSSFKGEVHFVDKKEARSVQEK